MTRCDDPVKVAELKLAEALEALARAEKKAAAGGCMAAADEVARRDREVAWRLHALRILREEENARE